MNYPKALLFVAISTLATFVAVNAMERPNQGFINSGEATQSGEGLNFNRQQMEQNQQLYTRQQPAKGNRRTQQTHTYNPESAVKKQTYNPNKQ